MAVCNDTVSRWQYVMIQPLDGRSDAVERSRLHLNTFEFTFKFVSCYLPHTLLLYLAVIVSLITAEFKAFKYISQA